jgi:hypothetical protein
VTFGPWADPYSFDGYAGYAGNKLAIDDFEFALPLLGGWDLTRLAAAISEAADVIVTDIEEIVYSDGPNSLCGGRGSVGAGLYPG